MDLRTTLQQLSQASGPSGNEEGVAALVRDLMAPLCDDVQVDPLFTVIGLKRGQGREVSIGAPRPQLALMAHIDEIYLLVTAIEGPFLRFLQHGYDPRLLVGQEVVVLGRQPLQGVIGDRPPHVLTGKDRAQMPRTEDLVIDLGLESDEVAANVAIGDAVLVQGPLTALLGERVAGKALDNRLGVATILAALDILQGLHHPSDILVIANSGEELNNLGAAAAAFRLVPDLAVVVDVTFGEQPGAGSDGTFPLGGGPVIGIGPNLHPLIAGKLTDVAAALEMGHGLEPLPSNTGTDAWSVEVAAGGIPCGLVSIPLRNMHSPVEVADLKDAIRTARLLASFAAQVDQSFVDSLTYKLPDFNEAAP